MSAFIGDFTDDEALQQAIESVGRVIEVQYIEGGKALATNHGIILCVTKAVVTVLMHGADVPIMFCRKTMQHVVPYKHGLAYVDDLWLVGKPVDVTLN